MNQAGRKVEQQIQSFFISDRSEAEKMGGESKSWVRDKWVSEGASKLERD